MNEEVKLKAELNDKFRSSGKGVALSYGVQTEIKNIEELLTEIKVFQGWSPYIADIDEHDFGSLYWEDNQTFWRISYFNGKRQLEAWESPLDQDCNRMITVMLAEEY